MTSRLSSTPASSKVAVPTSPKSGWRTKSGYPGETGIYSQDLRLVCFTLFTTYVALQTRKEGFEGHAPSFEQTGMQELAF
jgi:hypothetical protein